MGDKEIKYNQVVILRLIATMLTIGIAILMVGFATLSKQNDMLEEVDKIKRELADIKESHNKFIEEYKTMQKPEYDSEHIHEDILLPYQYIEPNEEPNEEEVMLLARLIHAEAKGEPYEGMIAVANVVLNRVESDEFPDTIKDVIYQKGQFQPVSNGAINNNPSDKAIKAARDALNGSREVNEDALYFYNPKLTKSNWMHSRVSVANIGNHTFAK